MTDTPKEIWCSTGLYWDYKDDWSEGSWRDNDNCAGVKYVRADRIEELEAQIEELHNGVTAAHFQGYMEGKQQTEAKLAKVVKSMLPRALSAIYKDRKQEVIDILETAIAELKGQDDE